MAESCDWVADTRRHGQVKMCSAQGSSCSGQHSPAWSAIRITVLLSAPKVPVQAAHGVTICCKIEGN